MRRHPLLISILTGLLLAGFAVGATAQPFSSLEERMTSEQFKAAGLDKLSPDQLATLDAFVRNEVETRSAQARVAGAREQDKNDAARIGFKDYHGSRHEIVSRIPGLFKGWSGSTEIKLENGQVWRQTDDSQFVGIHLQNAVAHIKPGMIGGWTLQVDGYGSYAKVERVQ